MSRRLAATIQLVGGSLGVGIGVDWASGTLACEGRQIPIDLHGISVARTGAAYFSASGEVYHLHDLADLAGKYGAASVDGGVLDGGPFMALRNDKGVVIRMNTIRGGLDKDFGIKGLSIALR
jgi:ABC-type amino acid transport substrate-binding protein